VRAAQPHRVKRTIEPSASDRSAFSHVGQRDRIRVHTKPVEVHLREDQHRFYGENDREQVQLNKHRSNWSCSSAPHSRLMPRQRVYRDVVDTATVGTISYTIKSTITAIHARHGSEDE
jgi:hypothetical protein